MGNSTVNLVSCNMRSSGGPAIDMTGTSVLHVNQGSIQDCVGETTTLYHWYIEQQHIMIKYIASALVWCRSVHAKVLIFSGGIWMWDHSSCELDRLQLQGGSSYAMFTDAGCQAQLKVSFCTHTMNCA